MKHNSLGNTKYQVSELGLGTAQIGGPSIIKGKPFGAKPISDKEAYNILTLARDAGINFYESADRYGDGLAEKRLGKFFKGSQDVIIATKCGLDENGERRFERAYVMRQVEGSLSRLKREQIDIFQFQKPTLTKAHDEDLAETVELLKQQGKIAYAGIVVGDIKDGYGFLEQGNWSTFQLIYNLLTLDFKDLIAKIADVKCGVIIRSPLSGGMLTGRFDENTKFPKSDDRSVFMHGKLLIDRCKIGNALKKKFGLSNDDLTIFSLNFLLSDPDISVIIPGATSTTQMVNNLKVIKKERIPFDQWKEIYNFAKYLATDI